MKPLITIDYTICRIHRTPRVTIRSPIAGTAIRYAIGTPVSDSSPVYTKPVPIDYGDTVHAVIYRGRDRVGEETYVTCKVPYHAEAQVSNPTKSSDNKELPVTDNTQNMSNTQFDGTWGSSDW